MDNERIEAFRVKDAEVDPDGREGVYSGYQPWIDRPGRFRSLADGTVDFASIFSRLAQYDYDSWAVPVLECCIKSPERGGAEGAPFIAGQLIDRAGRAFDDFAGGDRDGAAIGTMPGL